MHSENTSKNALLIRSRPERDSSEPKTDIHRYRQSLGAVTEEEPQELLNGTGTFGRTGLAFSELIRCDEPQIYQSRGWHWRFGNANRTRYPASQCLPKNTTQYSESQKIQEKASCAERFANGQSGNWKEALGLASWQHLSADGIRRFPHPFPPRRPLSGVRRLSKLRGGSRDAKMDAYTILMEAPQPSIRHRSNAFHFHQPPNNRQQPICLLQKSHASSWQRHGKEGTAHPRPRSRVPRKIA